MLDDPKMFQGEGVEELAYYALRNAELLRCDLGR